jgi:hypothetical protein
MNMELKTKHGVWQRFFAEGYTPDVFRGWQNTAEHFYRNFERGLSEGTIAVSDGFDTKSNRPDLDQWVASPTGQQMLTYLVRDIQSHILSVATYTLPAHDIRQILFKDATEGLRFLEMERPEGYKAAFIIPMFAHDIGRLLEGRFTHPDNPHHNWIPHSRLSYLLLKEILDQPQYTDMPKDLKFHFLYAVHAHSGDNGKSYMSRAVQTCDRMQLIGAEGFFRSLSYGLCLADADIAYPQDEQYVYDLPNMYDHRSVLSMQEYFSRNMRENIGDHHREWQQTIAIENVALLLKFCEDDQDLRFKMFAPEFCVSDVSSFGLKKKAISAHVFRSAIQLLDDFVDVERRPISPYEMTEELIHTLRFHKLRCLPGTADITDDMKRSIHRAVINLSALDRESLAATVAMADRLRAEQDELDRELALRVARGGNPYMADIARLALQYAPASVLQYEREYRAQPELIIP